MPSDPRLTQAIDAFAPLFNQYRSAVAATLEDIRGRLLQRASAADAGGSRLKSELGEFALGRIDAQRLNDLLGSRLQLTAPRVARLERAAWALRELAAQGEELMHVRVPQGEDLAATVRARLAEIGRAFGAARLTLPRVADSAMTADDERQAAALPFSRWTQAERRLGPPLVVSVRGEDLRPAGLAEFLDGLQKMVLIVEGDAPPAALVRLITPGVFVAQASDAAICARVVEWPGTAVAAIVPTTCAQFVHDPASGPELWQRLTLQQPAPATLAAVAGYTPAQQVEEVRQLEALVHRPAAAGRTAGTGEPVVDPADRVAAWLLRQADLIGPAGGQ